jgi:carboxypeptidase Taq
MPAYDDLIAFQKETEALAQVAGRLQWDAETVMPSGAAEQRGEEVAAMEGVLHARRTDPRLGEWLIALEGADLDPVASAQVRHVRRRYERTVRVPAKLAAELARVTSLAHGVWAAARRDEDYAAFAPTLKRVFALRREEAEAVALGGDLYDALLDEYEPGATQAFLTEMFDQLRPRLVALRDRVLGAPQPRALSGRFAEEGQLALSRELAVAFGYDLNHGRIDKAVHPFSSGSGLDVRITTRTSPADPFNCFYSTVHEVGHAAYEQGIDRAYLLTPIGQGCSMGVHESQSRIYENQLGRSRPFTGWLFERMRATFGDLGIGDADAFHAAVNRVIPGYIRTEADEVQYNLHVLLRFDLERDLLSGRLAVEDLPEAWNARFLKDFGVAVDRPSNGCLQDVHWSAGAIGYFPTYTLGNVYAGCLMQALRDAVPDLDAHLARGDTRPATEWLRERLQRHGGLRLPRETIEAACGFAPGEAPLLDYLDAKFGAIYGV